MRTSYDLFLPDDSMRVSFLLEAWLADASSRTLQTGRTQRGLNRKALVQPDPSHAQQSGIGDVQSALHAHGGPDDFRESRSSLLSCLAFSLASAFSSFLAFTIWDTEQRV